MNKTKNRQRPQGNCEQCNNYVYDEDYECYTCEMDLDEEDRKSVV